MACPECGRPPGDCYGICPLNDPYHGDQAAEAADYDFNAQFDDVRERYMEHCPKHGAYAGDCGGCEADHYAATDDDDDEVVTFTGIAVPNDTTGILPDLPLSAFDNDDDIPF